MNKNIPKRVHAVGKKENENVNISKKRKLVSDQQKTVDDQKNCTKAQRFANLSIENSTKHFDKNVKRTIKDCSEAC